MLEVKGGGAKTHVSLMRAASNDCRPRTLLDEEAYHSIVQVSNARSLIFTLMTVHLLLGTQWLKTSPTSSLHHLEDCLHSDTTRVCSGF
jgi:hypothetical protein